jgi:outer membrane protein assembly factor BamE (lipoprotein component of BamABCDE complex)
MKKNIFSLLILLIFITSCNQNKVITTHGLSYLEQREKLIVINKTNKNDSLGILGHPATKGMSNDNLWIYIERTKSSGKIIKLGKKHLTKNNVLVLEFNKYGVLKNKVFFDKDSMKDLTFAKNITENEIKKENFVYSFLSSIRQKMETKRK